MKLFRSKIEKACHYCSYAFETKDGWLLCTRKKRHVDADGKCLHFHYDPLKRVPVKAKTPDFSKYEEYDYSL